MVFRSSYLKYIENWQNIQSHMIFNNMEQAIIIQLLELRAKRLQLMEKTKWATCELPPALSNFQHIPGSSFQ